MRSRMKNVSKIDLHSHLPLLTPDDVTHDPLMQTLYRALSVKRPSGGIGEAKFAAWMAVTFGATLIDEAGNIHFDRRTNGERTLFTAHSDTVHYKDGDNAIRNDGRYWRACGDMLGADDGAGCALIAHMLTQGVSGYYIVFRGEEVGGVGSKWLAKNMPELLVEFDRAIAFDRAGEYDVITHQAGTRCCSDLFAAELSNQLSLEESGLMFMPSDGGVYTDTAEFTELIPECTNVSVGYLRQHSDEEQQDILFLQALADTLCLVDWESLPTERDPSVTENLWANWSSVADWPKYGISFEEYGKKQSEQKMLALEELELFETISEAIVSASFAGLLLKVRELLQDNENTFKVQALTDDFLDDCLTALLNGFTAYDVAQDLREVMING